MTGLGIQTGRISEMATAWNPLSMPLDHGGRKARVIYLHINKKHGTISCAPWFTRNNESHEYLNFPTLKEKLMNIKLEFLSTGTVGNKTNYKTQHVGNDGTS